MTGSFVDAQLKLADQVDQEKMKAIGARNLLKSLGKQREAQMQRLQALISERDTELLRYAGMRVCDAAMASAQVLILPAAVAPRPGCSSSSSHSSASGANRSPSSARLWASRPACAARRSATADECPAAT